MQSQELTSQSQEYRGHSDAAIRAAVAHCEAKSAWVRVQNDYRDGKITTDQRRVLQAPINVAWDATWAEWERETAKAEGGRDACL